MTFEFTMGRLFSAVFVCLVLTWCSGFILAPALDMRETHAALVAIRQANADLGMAAAQLQLAADLGDGAAEELGEAERAMHVWLKMAARYQRAYFECRGWKMPEEVGR